MTGINIYQVTFIDQSNGKTHTEHVVARNLAQIEAHYADVQNVRVVDIDVDDITDKDTK